MFDSPFDSYDPNTPFGQKMQGIKAQWIAAQRIVQNLAQEVRERYEVYEHHSGEAARIRLLREQQANQFMAKHDDLKYRIKHAKQEVLSDMRRERQMIHADYFAETAHLRFWNIIKLAKAKVKHFFRLKLHDISMGFQSISSRTKKKKRMYRDQLLVVTREYQVNARAARDAQWANTWESWAGPFRPKGGGSPGFGAAPAT